MTTDPYFADTIMPWRQALLWASAVRRQLGRWEPLVAKHCRVMNDRSLSPKPAVPTTMTTEEMWQGEIERHFLLVAAHDLLKAIDLLDAPPAVDATVRAELTEARDLVEHWVENMPHFMVSDRPGSPGYKTGKNFAARNPRAGPYNWWSWNSQRGPMVTPNVSGEQVHELVAVTINVVVSVHPDLAEAVPPVPVGPWVVTSGGGWWPKQDPA